MIFSYSIIAKYVTKKRSDAETLYEEVSAFLHSKGFIVCLNGIDQDNDTLIMQASTMPPKQSLRGPELQETVEQFVDVIKEYRGKKARREAARLAKRKKVKV